MKTLTARLAVLTLPFSALTAQAACPVGIYGAGERDRVVITMAIQGNGAQRYIFVDGRRGGVNAPEAPVRCEADALQVKAADGSWAAWPQIPYKQTPTRFKSHGSELGGVLIEAASPGATQPPLTIYVHGSEKTAALGTAYPYVLASQGMSVFVFDKRGTGSSEGYYTQNFDLLAEDAVAASVEARRLAEGRYARFGFAGFSQGGWIAPLAAKRSAANFVAVGFGLMLSPLEEDEEQVMTELREAGHDAAILAKARQVTAATGDLVASHFATGYTRLAALKRRYAKEPWLAQIKGEFTGAILNSDEATLRRLGVPLYDNLALIWRYDAIGVLKSLDTPLLWVIAGADREAPGEVTEQRLGKLKQAGKKIDLYVYPDTDHGMFEFVQAADGSREITRVTEGYFRLLGDWITGRASSAPYGRGKKVF